MHHKKSIIIHKKLFIRRKIPARLFFSFWAITGTVFLHLGFKSFDNTALSSSVSPLLNSLFKHSLAISTCHSTSYALIFRPIDVKNSIKRRHFWVTLALLPPLCFSSVNEILALGILIHVFSKLITQLCNFDQEIPLKKKSPFTATKTSLKEELLRLTNVFPLIVTITFFSILSFSFYFVISTLLFIIVAEYYFREKIICFSIQFAIELSMFLIGGSGHTKFFPILVLFIALITSSISDLESIISDKKFKNLLPLTSSETKETISIKKREAQEMFHKLKNKNWGKFAKFAIGLAGTVMFQNFFRLRTFSDVKAFLYLAVAWVANLTLVRASGDLGILNFLLGNVIVGCTVSEFGIGSTTWIAYGACLLLFGVRLKLRSLTYYFDGKELQVVLY